MQTKRRWLIAALEASKTETIKLPWQRQGRTRPSAFKHAQPDAQENIGSAAA